MKNKTDGGNNTTDKVFLLSIDEVNMYFASDSERMATLSDGTSVYWWLRSPGYYDKNAAGVAGSGWVRDDGNRVNDDNVGIRPALWINLES